jgi:hypothetical protein
MNSFASVSDELCETRRLQALLPPEWRSRITIGRSTKANAALISARKIERNQFAIHIDLERWQQFSSDQRDLLFWHEVSRIQAKTITRLTWEPIVMSVGLSVACKELVSQSLLSFSIGLAITGLAGYQLYQRKRGEQSLREATAADQRAIEMAVEAGYSVSEAYSSLHHALRLLARQATRKSRWKTYQVRLRVLEILAANYNTTTPSSTALALEEAMPRQRVDRLTFSLPMLLH